jgi:hypothetical protein
LTKHLGFSGESAGDLSGFENPSASGLRSLAQLDRGTGFLQPGWRITGQKIREPNLAPVHLNRVAQLHRGRIPVGFLIPRAPG